MSGQPLKPIADSILFGMFALFAMLVGVLYPSDSGRLLVVLPNSEPPERVFRVLENSGGWLVEKIGNRTFVVESEARGFSDSLYENGALLVLNGDAKYGCGAPEITIENSIKNRNPYRRSVAKN